MGYIRGEDIVLGVGVQSSRDTAVEPQMWIPGRTPSGIKPILEKVMVRETRGTKMGSQDSEIVQKRAEGDLEFNVRNESIGFIMKSLLGKLESTTKDGETEVYRHTVSILPNNPEHPALTIGLHQPDNSDGQDYEYPLGIPVSVSFKIVTNDLVSATVTFLASQESEKEGDAYEPVFVTRDYRFRHQDATVKIADDVASLSGASALSIKELTVDIPNNGRADHNISEVEAGNVLGMDITPGGQIVADLIDKTYHDIFTSGSSKAFQLVLEREDITIGDSSHPRIEIVFPKITFEGWDPNRAIDDIVGQTINFSAHYDASEGEGVSVVIDNERADYDAESES